MSYKKIKVIIRKIIKNYVCMTDKPYRMFNDFTHIKDKNKKKNKKKQSNFMSSQLKIVS